MEEPVSLLKGLFTSIPPLYWLRLRGRSRVFFLLALSPSRTSRFRFIVGSRRSTNSRCLLSSLTHTHTQAKSAPPPSSLSHSHTTVSSIGWIIRGGWHVSYSFSLPQVIYSLGLFFFSSSSFGLVVYIWTSCAIFLHFIRFSCLDTPSPFNLLHRPTLSPFTYLIILLSCPAPPFIFGCN